MVVIVIGQIGQAAGPEGASKVGGVKLVRVGGRCGCLWNSVGMQWVLLKGGAAGAGMCLAHDMGLETHHTLDLLLNSHECKTAMSTVLPPAVDSVLNTCTAVIDVLAAAVLCCADACSLPLLLGGRAQPWSPTSTTLLTASLLP